MTTTIYHNPKCGTSRNTLELIRSAGIEPTVIEYLKTPPDKVTLTRLIGTSGQSVRSFLRERGTPYADLDLGNEKWSDEQLIDFMLEHPILLNRPVVETPLGVKLCRPSETLMELLTEDQKSRIPKKDDQEVADKAGKHA